MPDLIEGLKAVLLADPGVSTLTQANGGPVQVFNSELPTSSDLSMPAKVVVIRPGGGSERFSQGTLQIGDRTVNTLIYGETAHLAQVVYEAVYHAFKTLTPSVWAGTYIHWCKPASGPIAAREAMLQWPYIACRWQVLASDITVS